MIDPESLANLDSIPRGPPGPGSDEAAAADEIRSVARSVATTALATEVGSVVGRPKDAFLRSITFYKNDEIDWLLEICDPPRTSAGGRWGSKKKNQKLTVGNIGGVIEYSTIQPGDVLLSINGKRIGPSYNAERAMDLMKRAYEDDGVLSVQVGNDQGDDVLVQATILKPSPEMGYKDLGLIVWNWGVLCIKQIDKESIFKHTVLKEADHILSVNNIDCDRVKPDGFARIFDELPCEITIVVKRGKQRWTGRFG